MNIEDDFYFFFFSGSVSSLSSSWFILQCRGRLVSFELKESWGQKIQFLFINILRQELALRRYAIEYVDWEIIKALAQQHYLPIHFVIHDTKFLFWSTRTSWKPPSVRPSARKPTRRTTVQLYIFFTDPYIHSYSESS